MQFRMTRWYGLAAALALTVSLTSAPAAPVGEKEEKPKAGTPAEKVRQALDATLANLEIENQPLNLAIDQLHEETKINFVLDANTIAQMGIDINTNPVKCKVQNVKVKSALRNILNQYSLAYAIVGDSVVITTEEMAVYRQLKQRVSLDLDKVPMATALKNLAKETATNLLIDGRATKDAQNAVSLQVEDVPLDTAVRLVTESAGLKAVRLGNVVLVTTKAHATELRAEPELAPNPRNPGGVELPPNAPGIAVPVPFGVLPGGAPPPVVPPAPDKPGADPDKPADKPAEKPAEKPPEPKPDKPGDR
jgi:hypothetical protein